MSVVDGVTEIFLKAVKENLSHSIFPNITIPLRDKQESE